MSLGGEQGFEGQIGKIYTRRQEPTEGSQISQEPGLKSTESGKFAPPPPCPSSVVGLVPFTFVLSTHAGSEIATSWSPMRLKIECW